MEQNPPNTSLEQMLSNMLTDVASEVTVHLDQDEEVLLSLFLGLTKFETLEDLLHDIECFLKEELDLSSISRDNVAEVNFSGLATKFGKRYGLNAIKKLTDGQAEQLNDLGWKSTRTILVRVLLPELKNMPFADAQFFVMTFEEFITKYSLIRGEDPDSVLDQLMYRNIFKEYQFTLELDSRDSKKHKALPPPDEYIRWAGKKYTVEQAGEDLEKKYKLIADKQQWVQFFEDHQQPIEVVPGELKRFILVLYEMEGEHLFDKSKGKGCWKIWQLILADEDGQPFSPELRKIRSRINAERTETDKELCQYRDTVIKDMMKIEKGS